MSSDGFCYMSPGLPLMPYPRHLPPRYFVIPDRRKRVTAEVNWRHDREVTVFVRTDSAQFDGMITRMEKAAFLLARAVGQGLERAFEGKVWGHFEAGERLGLGFGTCLLTVGWASEAGISWRSVLEAAKRGVEEHFENLEILGSSADLLQILAVPA